jgi:hypothetical protein
MYRDGRSGRVTGIGREQAFLIAKRPLILAILFTYFVGVVLLVLMAIGDMSAFGRGYFIVLAVPCFLAAGVLSFALGKADVLRPIRVEEIPLKQLRRDALLQIGWFFLQGTLVWVALAFGEWAWDVQALLVAGALVSTTWALVLAIKGFCPACRGRERIAKELMINPLTGYASLSGQGSVSGARTSQALCKSAKRARRARAKLPKLSAVSSW